MRWRMPLFLGAAVLAVVGAISAFIAFGAPGGDDPAPFDIPPEILAGLPPETIVIAPTPAPLTPTPAAEGGRPDCPQDWAVYSDPDGYFSLCYPADWNAVVAEPQAYFGYTFSLFSTDPRAALPPDGVSLTMYWSEFATLDPTALDDRCRSFADWRDGQGVTLTLAGRSVPACVGDASEAGDVPAGAPRVRGTFADIPLGPNQGYVALSLTEVGETSNLDREPLLSVFRSLRIGQ